MIVGIDFKIYHNFGQYVNANDGYDYNNALKVLNEMLEKLVKKNKLTILYKRRRCKIILPVTLKDCGNIFETKYGDREDSWDGISIRCEVDCEYNDFEWDKLVAGTYPDNFVPLVRFVG